jgi:hypothetical protein
MSGLLSLKLCAEYAELANTYLDHIPINSTDEFQRVEEALQSIIEPDTHHSVHPALQGWVEDVKELCEHPELYVQQPAAYEAYKTLVRARVAAKIHELAHLTLAQKGQYIAEQRGAREDALRYHELVSRALPPGPEARVVTEEEWLRQEQDRFQREGVAQTRFQRIVATVRLHWDVLCRTIDDSHGFSNPYPGYFSPLI